MDDMTDVEKALAAWAEGLDEETRQRALNALAGPVDEDGQPLEEEDSGEE